MALPRTDPYSQNDKEPAMIDALWLASLVDTFNSAMTIIEDELASLDARLTAIGG